MAGIIQNLVQFGLTLSLMDREVFVKEVSSFLEQYRNDPAMMESVAQKLYQYLEDMKHRMDMKEIISGAHSNQQIPTKADIDTLKEAIEKLTEEIKKNNPDK